MLTLRLEDIYLQPELDICVKEYGKLWIIKYKKNEGVNLSTLLKNHTYFLQKFKRRISYLMSGTPAGSDTTGVKAGVICRLPPFGVCDFLNALNFSFVLVKESDTSCTSFFISLIF